jgi:hypothetical protein
MGLVNLALLIFQGPRLEQNVEGLILNGSMNLEIVTVQRLSLCLRSVHSGPSCSSFAAAIVVCRTHRPPQARTEKGQFGEGPIARMEELGKPLFWFPQSIPAP